MLFVCFWLVQTVHSLTFCHLFPRICSALTDRERSQVLCTALGITTGKEPKITGRFVGLVYG